MLAVVVAPVMMLGMARIIVLVMMFAVMLVVSIIVVMHDDHLLVISGRLVRAGVVDARYAAVVERIRASAPPVFGICYLRQTKK